MSWCVCVRPRGEIESACVRTSACVGVFECVLALPLGVYNKRQQTGQTLTALSSSSHQPGSTNPPHKYSIEVSEDEQRGI